MYPFLRVLPAIRRARRGPRIQPGEVHVVRTRCWPTDVDQFWELNNGRSLTLMDMGRMSILRGARVAQALGPKGLRLAIAGATVQYRRRVRLWERLEIRTRIIGTDARFFYIEQVIYAGGEFAHHAVFRAVAAGPKGIARMGEALGGLEHPGWRAELPEWVRDWAAAEAKRERPEMGA